MSESISRCFAPGFIMVDDNALAAAAMERRFRGAREVRWLGWTGDVKTAGTLVREQRPQVVLLDVEIPGSDAFAALRDLLAEHPALVVVMFSGHDDPALVDRALAEGAAGYIHKDEPTSTIAALLSKAAGGDCVLSPLVARVYIPGGGGKNPAGH